MATANPLDELRRRVGHGAAPGAFAALAEEHRRAGRFAEAVDVCREGLERYPTYVSARVTLGRALLDMGDVQAALAELTHAVDQAPDNLAAARALETARALAAEAALDAAHEPASDAVHQPVPGDMPEPASAPPGEAASSDASLMSWLTQPDDDRPDADAIGHAFTSEWQPPPAADVGGEAAASRADGEDGRPGAWDETLYAPATPTGDWPAAVDPDEEATAADPSTPLQREAGLGDWGVIELPRGADEAPAVPWDVSVGVAVSEVFARAAGEEAPTLPADTDNEPSTGATLDTLQALLGAIRARRAALAATHSDVD